MRLQPYIVFALLCFTVACTKQEQQPIAPVQTSRTQIIETPTRYFKGYKVYKDTADYDTTWFNDLKVDFTLNQGDYLSTSIGHYSMRADSTIHAKCPSCVHYASYDEGISGKYSIYVIHNTATNKVEEFSIESISARPNSPPVETYYSLQELQ